MDGFAWYSKQAGFVCLSVSVIIKMVVGTNQRTCVYVTEWYAVTLIKKKKNTFPNMQSLIGYCNSMDFHTAEYLCLLTFLFQRLYSLVSIALDWKIPQMCKT